MNEFKAVSAEELDQVDGGKSALDAIVNRLVEQIIKSVFRPLIRDLTTVH